MSVFRVTLHVCYAEEQQLGKQVAVQKEHSPPEDGQLLVTETCRVTRDTNILMV
jgi:hypothetical protein